jgi:hypothetical protein
MLAISDAVSSALWSGAAVVGIAIAGGLFRIGNTLGRLEQALTSFEKRLEMLEKQIGN